MLRIKKLILSFDGVLRWELSKIVQQLWSQDTGLRSPFDQAQFRAALYAPVAVRVILKHSFR